MAIIHGATQGLSPSIRKVLDRMYQRRVPFDVVVTNELANDMVRVSHATGRQVGVIVDRAGTVEHVVIGDASKLMLPDIGRARAAQGRLRGLRLLHTHLFDEPLTRDDLVDLTRLRFDLIAAICLAPGEERARCLYWGHNVPVAEGRDDPPYRTFGPIPWAKVDVDPSEVIPALEQEYARHARTRDVVAKDGRAILIHVDEKRRGGSRDARIHELDELARTAGVEVVDTIVQRRDRIDPKFVLGRGKLDEVVIRAMQRDVEVLIFDRELSARQAAAIAAATELKVLDRTQLILDIFAQRAESRDGKLQVELAQMKYLLPRLGQTDDALSRLTGGIGGRGPGETKLEIGRRRARERINRLQKQIREQAKKREQRRARRQRSNDPVVSIIGYTNAGKSTLLNALTGAGVLAEDKLFATLDTRSRRLDLPSGAPVVMTDTVGFIRDLPKDLFAAFRATFEEAADADLLVQLVDASDPEIEAHLVTTDKLLDELDLTSVRRLHVFNKIDRVDPEHAERLCREHDGVGITALDVGTLKPFLERVEAALNAPKPPPRGALADHPAFTQR